MKQLPTHSLTKHRLRMEMLYWVCFNCHFLNIMVTGYFSLTVLERHAPLLGEQKRKQKEREGKEIRTLDLREFPFNGTTTSSWNPMLYQLSYAPIA